MRQYVRKATDALGRADDAVQRVIREKVLRVPDYGPMEDGPLSGFRKGVAKTIHSPRAGGAYGRFSEFENNASGRNAMIASRVIQAAGITAAGSGLIQLTNALTGSQQTDSQLPM